MKKIHDKYPYLVAWTKLFHCHDSFLTDQISLAEGSEAPANAIYFIESENKWRTFDDLSETTKKDLQPYLPPPVKQV